MVHWVGSGTWPHTAEVDCRNCCCSKQKLHPRGNQLLAFQQPLIQHCPEPPHPKSPTFWGTSKLRLETPTNAHPYGSRLVQNLLRAIRQPCSTCSLILDSLSSTKNCAGCLFTLRNHSFPCYIWDGLKHSNASRWALAAERAVLSMSLF